MLTTTSCDTLIELIPLIQVAGAANLKLMQINMANVRDQVRNMQKVELARTQRKHSSQVIITLCESQMNVSQRTLSPCATWKQTATTTTKPEMAAM